MVDGKYLPPYTNTSTPKTVMLYFWQMWEKLAPEIQNNVGGE